MKVLFIFLAILVFDISTSHSAEKPSRQADRELLARLHSTVVPALTMKDVTIESAIARYLGLVAAAWHSPKPLPYRIEKPKTQAEQQAPHAPRVTFSFSEDSFAARLRELIPLAGLSSFTVRGGVIIISPSRNLYDDEIWKQPLLPPK